MTATTPPSSSGATGTAPPWPAPRSGQRRARATLAALSIAAVCAVVTAGASRETSTTFDEIVLMAGGARGYEEGAWDLAPEHPPLMQYLYGLPIWLSRPNFPERVTAPPREVRDFSFRYKYSRDLFWRAGNDPERLTLLGRSVAAILAGLLVVSVFVFTRRFGDGTAILATALVALLPDVLAHGGVAYNDLPVALAYLLAIWALDAAIQQPTLARGATAGLCVALAISVKFNAVLLAPAAVLLFAIADVTRRDKVRSPRFVAATVAALATAYLTLVAVYRGDPTLAEMRYGLDYTFRHATLGHGSPAYLLGTTSPNGWWYYFPIAFLYKTPLAFHLIVICGIAGILRVTRAAGLRAMALSDLRAPVIGCMAVALALLTSSLDIGFRYALPALPLLCIVAAVGVTRLMRPAGASLRWALTALLVWHGVSTLSFYPHFLGYVSEYAPRRDRGDLVLLDSSLDWGQGLLALRDWMRRQGVDRVSLSYFGTALPAGYGIAYVPLPSYPTLPSAGPPPSSPPRYTVISATNLHGIYLKGDPFAHLRARQPHVVLARSLLVYRTHDDAR